MTGERTIDVPRRIARIADWGVKYTASQLEQSLEDLDQEANISAIITLANKGGDAKKQFLKAIRGIQKATDNDGISFAHLMLRDMIEICYPSVKLQEGKAQDYEPYLRMTALNSLLTNYKRVSISAYDKINAITSILKLRSYAIATLPEDDIHQKATNKLREYSKHT